MFTVALLLSHGVNGNKEFCTKIKNVSTISQVPRIDLRTDFAVVLEQQLARPLVVVVFEDLEHIRFLHLEPQ